jgi:hypothetical protein
LVLLGYKPYTASGAPSGLRHSAALASQGILHFQRFDSFAQNPDASPKRFLFVICERQRNARQRALASDSVGQRRGDIIAARHAVKPGADGQDGALIVEDNIDDANDGAANAILGCAFPGDNMVKRVLRNGAVQREETGVGCLLGSRVPPLHHLLIRSRLLRCCEIGCQVL